MIITILILTYFRTFVECKSKFPQSINVALETVVDFDKKDRYESLKFINEAQTFLKKLEDALGDNVEYRKHYELDNDKDYKFTDFLQDTLETLTQMKDHDLEHVKLIFDDEIRKYHYKGSRFHELTGDNIIRRFMSDNLDKVKKTSARDIKRALKYILMNIADKKLSGENRNLLEFINSIYSKSNKKLKSTVRKLESYSKSREKNTGLENIVKNSVKDLIFDHYSKLSFGERKELKIRALEFIRNFVEQSEPKKIETPDWSWKFPDLLTTNAVTNLKRETKKPSEKIPRIKKFFPLPDIDQRETVSESSGDNIELSSEEQQNMKENINSYFSLRQNYKESIHKKSSEAIKPTTNIYEELEYSNEKPKFKGRSDSDDSDETDDISKINKKSNEAKKPTTTIFKALECSNEKPRFKGRSDSDDSDESDDTDDISEIKVKEETKEEKGKHNEQNRVMTLWTESIERVKKTTIPARTITQKSLYIKDSESSNSGSSEDKKISKSNEAFVKKIHYAKQKEESKSSDENSSSDENQSDKDSSSSNSGSELAVWKQKHNNRYSIKANKRKTLELKTSESIRRADPVERNFMDHGLSIEKTTIESNTETVSSAKNNTNKIVNNLNQTLRNTEIKSKFVESSEENTNVNQTLRNTKIESKFVEASEEKKDLNKTLRKTDIKSKFGESSEEKTDLNQTLRNTEIKSKFVESSEERKYILNQTLKKNEIKSKFTESRDEKANDFEIMPFWEGTTRQSSTTKNRLIPVTTIKQALTSRSYKNYHQYTTISNTSSKTTPKENMKQNVTFRSIMIPVKEAVESYENTEKNVNTQEKSKAITKVTTNKHTTTEDVTTTSANLTTLGKTLPKHRFNIKHNLVTETHTSTTIKARSMATSKQVERLSIYKEHSLERMLNETQSKIFAAPPNTTLDDDAKKERKIQETLMKDIGGLLKKKPGEILTQRGFREEDKTENQEKITTDIVNALNEQPEATIKYEEKDPILEDLENDLKLD